MSGDSYELVMEGSFDDVDNQYEGRAIVMSLKAPIYVNGELQEGKFQNEEIGLTVALRSWDNRHGSFGMVPDNQHKLAKLFAKRKVKLVLTTTDDHKPLNVDIDKLFDGVKVDDTKE